MAQQSVDLSIHVSGLAGVAATCGADALGASFRLTVIGPALQGPRAAGTRSSSTCCTFCVCDPVVVTEPSSITATEGCLSAHPPFRPCARRLVARHDDRITATAFPAAQLGRFGDESFDDACASACAADDMQLRRKTADRNLVLRIVGGGGNHLGGYLWYR